MEFEKVSELIRCQAFLLTLSSQPNLGKANFWQCNTNYHSEGCHYLRKVMDDTIIVAQRINIKERIALFWLPFCFACSNVFQVSIQDKRRKTSKEYYTYWVLPNVDQQYILYCMLYYIIYYIIYCIIKEFTLVGCLSVYSHIVTLDNGQQLHSMVIKCGYIGDLFVGITLVDVQSFFGFVVLAFRENNASKIK